MRKGLFIASRISLLLPLPHSLHCLTRLAIYAYPIEQTAIMFNLQKPEAGIIDI